MTADLTFSEWNDLQSLWQAEVNKDSCALPISPILALHWVPGGGGALAAGFRYTVQV